MDLLFTTTSIKRLIYYIFVTAAAFLVPHYISDSQVYWLIWSALILSLITTGETFLRRLMIIILTGVMAAFMVWMTASLVHHIYLLAVSLFIITAAGAIIIQRWPQYYISVTAVIILSVLSAGLPAPMTDHFHRAVLVMMGLGIAVLFQLAFLPFYFRNQVTFTLITALHNMRVLNTEIFSCLTQIEYADNIYLFERRIHIQKRKCVNTMMRLHKLVLIKAKKVSNKKYSNLKLVAANLEQLYEGMLDYAQLRRRVSDYNTFAVCKQELDVLAHEINGLFVRLIKTTGNKAGDFNLEQLTAGIYRMEENYHNVIQIAAREPLVFLLFVSSLNSFQTSLQALHQSIRSMT